VIGKSKWRVEEREKHRYAWLLLAVLPTWWLYTINDIKEIKDEYEHPNHPPPLVEESAEGIAHQQDVQAHVKHVSRAMEELQQRPGRSQPKHNLIEPSPIYPQV
jgi:hypothetical protein